MMVKPIRPLELYYQMIHFLKINYITQIYQRSQEHFHLKMIYELAVNCHKRQLESMLYGHRFL